MAKYTEYDFKYDCDIDNIKVIRHLKEIGEITIYENNIESEKEIFVDDDNVRYRLRRVTMVSGAVHYLLIDKHEYPEEDKPEKFVLAIYNNGKNRGYVQCIDTKYNDGISFVKVFEKKHATIFTLYPEDEHGVAKVTWGKLTKDEGIWYEDFINNFEPFAVIKQSV